MQNQFLPDGGNFEGSTCYHRLSAEISAWGLALVLALPADRLAGLFEPSAAVLAQGRSLPGAALGPLPAHDVGDGRRTPSGPDVLDRMARARAFTLDITKPSGRVPQIGDNDSGRFVKLAPVARPRAAGDRWPAYANPEHLQAGGAADIDWSEDHLDHAHLVDAIDGLLGISEPDELGVDGAIIRALAEPASALGRRPA